MTNKESQAIWAILIRDPQLRCTCDEVIREKNHFQASGHYHHCMLHQVARAVEISLMYRDGYRLVNDRMTKASFDDKSKEVQL